LSTRRDEDPQAAAARRRRSYAFLARFIGLLVLFYIIVASNPVNDHVIVPFTSAIASTSGAFLRAVGEPVTVAGTVIRSPGFSVNIENGCNGVETALLFGSAVLAFPAAWGRRLLGLLLGFLAIQAINLVRVVTLFWVGLHKPSLFHSSHTVLWQSAIVLFGVLFFLFWAARQTRPRQAEPTA
jgi:exosortase H (IPTLxxWG-CTERM-specific)